MDPILKNQFVTEYVGELLTSDEAEERGKVYDHVGMTYLFDLDYNQDEPAAYTVDAKKYGNISHFINHSVSQASSTWAFSAQASQKKEVFCVCAAWGNKIFFLVVQTENVHVMGTLEGTI